MATPSVAEWLAALRNNDEIRYQLIESVRAIVLQVGPSIGEEIKYGGILFAGHRGFCGIFSYANHVTLEFSEGASLPDPHQRLEGKGKGRRHIKLGSISDIESHHVRDYVALAYQASQSS
ncbi:DUF1801 domain-containing protein [Devosia sp. FKR38]|uniref:DUF1801 domain-containing protein n=1 Tax=Devosia sp. FKR38 TaxID=2562312 RepID=UPI0010C0ECFF|nr:DUF1801 domain-containing protein [Devosia sp. FKR38]